MTHLERARRLHGHDMAVCVCTKCERTAAAFAEVEREALEKAIVEVERTEERARGRQEALHAEQVEDAK